MANLTITVDEEVLRQARIRALAQGKSVNAILGDYLKSYADLRAAQEDATRTLIRLSRRSKVTGSKTNTAGGRFWERSPKNT